MADGTEVTLDIQGGQLDQPVLHTEAGIATTRFKAPPGQTVTLTARAGSAQSSLQWPSSLEHAPLLDFKLQDERYGQAAQAILKARNAVRLDGANLTADNPTRRVDFSPTGLTFNLKQTDDDFKGEKPNIPQEERLSLSFQLTDLRVGRQSLLSGPLERGASDNWVTYQTAGSAWQLAYEVGEASVEQYFVFEKGLPTDGDLVIEGVFDTRLRLEFLSNEAGIRFVPSQVGPDRIGEVQALAYGPALVIDAQGRQLTAVMELKGQRVQLTIPAAWLAQAEFPVVVDPMIGPTTLVSGLSGDVTDPAVASDGSKFLSVWSWQGDIYGQLVESDGALSGALITISQADGLQATPDVVYNPANGQYLVAWNDHRYGFTYNTLRAQHLSANGQLLGSELELLPPTQSANYPALAASTAGNYLVVWSDQSSSSTDVYGQMLNSSGVLSGTRLTLSNAASTQTYPDVAYDGQANVFLTLWSDRRDGSTYDIFSQQVTASGVISGTAQQLAGPGDGKDLTWPAVAANGNGQFLATWQREVSSSNHDVHAQRVTASTGQAAGGTIDIDNQSGSKEHHPAVTGTANGEYLVAWRDDGDIEARRVASDGSLPGSMLPLSEPTSGTRDDPVVAHGNGQSLGVWTDTSLAGQTILTGRRVSDSGSSSGDEIFISPYHSRRERVASASSSTSAEFLLAWEQAASSPTADIFIQRLDGQGQAIGDPLNLTNQVAAQERPALATGQNGYLAVWRDNRDQAATGLDIYGQLLTASGAPTASLIAINTATDTQSNPAVAYNTQQNNYLVVWDDNRAGNNADIYGQVINSDGSLVGSGFSLSISNAQEFPDVVYNPDQNTYLVVWEDKQSSSSDDIYGQVISADSSLVGNNFAIASATSNQFDPVVAYQSSSQTYLVAWWDKRNGNYDIYGQFLSSTGVLSGSNFAIANPSTGTNNDQEYPAVAALPGPASPDQFLIVWQDRRNGSSRDIYGQRVSATGILLNEPDTGADETNPQVNIPFDTGSDYTERPVVSYNTSALVYLLAWNNRGDGGVYTRRYTPTSPPTSTARFTAAPTSGVVPLVVTFTDISTGTVVSRTWKFGDGITTTVTSSAPLSHTYLATGTFSVVLTVTNPSGSGVTSTLITVTEQTTPSLTADFESPDLASDPTFWLDQFYDATVRDDFETLWAGDTRALGTAYAQNNTIYSHYAIPGWAAWKNYEYTGRMKMTDPAGGLGLALYSRYPAGEQKVYALRRYAGTPETESFHLVGFGTNLKGDTQLELTPQANAWYHFRVQTVTQLNRVTLRLKVWQEGQAEPTLWQADAYDDSASRSTAGAMGLRTYGPGMKYFDDLVVTPLNVQADFTVSAQAGLAPFSPTFTATPLGQVLTYTWNFGDGSALYSSSTTTTTHTYAEAGSYTVGLTVQGPAGSDTLTRPGYVVASNLNSGLRGYWKLEEANGLRLDSSTYGNHLTETNMVASAAGRVGQAADLERSSSEYLSISHTLQSGLGITGSLTLAGWVKPESLNQDKVLAGKYEYGVNNRAYRLTMRADNTPELIVSPDGTGLSAYTLAATNTLSAATWYHLAGVFDAEAQTLAIYLGGTLAATRSITYNTIYPSTAPFMLGANVNNGSPSQYFDGLLDEWRVYARALNQAEIQSLMATTPPTVTFSATPLTGTVPLTVAFSNTTSGSATYLWNFGDNLTSTLINPTHFYTRAGVYTVSLTATGAGGSATLTKTNYLTFSAAFTQNWRLVTTTVSPPVSGEHAMAYDSVRNRVVLYGGDGSGWPYANATWEFNGTNWFTITTAVSPTARYGAAMAYDSVRGVMILFGGSTADDVALNQTWEYTSTNWAQISPVTSPLSRTYASLVAGPNGTLYLFGGNNSATYYDDLWKYDNGTWSVITTTGQAPLVRTLAGMTYDPVNNRLLLFGGRSVTGTMLADLWSINPISSTAWTQINGSGGPPGRIAHSLTYHPATSHVVLIGGATNNSDTLLGDTWHYREGDGWTLATPTTPLPARAYHQAIYNNGIILFSNREVWKYE